MYDNFKLLNYSNSLVSPELYARHMSRLFPGNVVNGLLVIPNTGLIVTLPTGNGFIPYGSGATASNREFSLVADFDITLDTADASNPRIDLIVVYVDLAVALPGGEPGVANLDGPGVVKATFVKGTPNASPVDPTVGAIQTKIGASNPYIVVAAVLVDALVGTIAANKITDRRVMVGPSASFVTKIPAASILETQVNFSTTNWTPTITTAGSMTFTGVTTTAWYLNLGSVYYIWIRSEGTTGGTASLGFDITNLPFAAQATEQALTAIADVGANDSGWAQASGTTINVRRPAAANWNLGSSRGFIISGFIKKA